MKQAAPFVAAVSALSIAAMAEARDLYIYNWADYFGETTVSDFEAETGLSVTLDYFDASEVLETKLLTGQSGYDLVFPAASLASRVAQAGALVAIDPARLSNYANLDAGILAALDGLAGGRSLGVPYTWGTIGLAYNRAAIEARLGATDTGTLDLLFDPETAGKLADCGIAVLDSPVEMLSVTLNYLGADPYSADTDDLARARATFEAVRPSIRYFSNQRATGDLAAGNLCLALIYSGDAGLAQARAEEAGNDIEIVYEIPREGTLMWIDLMAIPADATNVDSAYRFIDHMLRPEVIADVTNTVFFANANAASVPHVDAEIRGDTGIYPEAGTRARLFSDRSVDARMQRQRTRLWTAIKSGT